MDQKIPHLIANETLYQLSYAPSHNRGHYAWAGVKGKHIRRRHRAAGRIPIFEIDPSGRNCRILSRHQSDPGETMAQTP
ncbi:MAG: hypothetical protein PHV34_09640 [Verrucomicrobiae bacterium]|nr:hypothetical protein [Verrucomicrobiae bacterium]